MRIAIIGNGLSGTICAKMMRESGSDAQIDIFGEENYYYYPRPNLIEYLSGNISYEKIFAFPEDWYTGQRIDVHCNNPVLKISVDTKELELKKGKKEKYDKLLLASGSRSFIPPIKGIENKNVFTFRSLEDCHALIRQLEKRKKVVVLGGGLLGLEIARALKKRGAEVKIVEFFSRLLPRQLDQQGALFLKREIESYGIKVCLAMGCEEISDFHGKLQLKFNNKSVMEAEIVVVAAGVRPDIELAKKAGLETKKGIVVNDLLQTGNSSIYGTGDGIQHNGRLYGIIPACFEQAKIVSSNIHGGGESYKGTTPSNTLKVMKTDLTSIGLVNPEEKGLEEIVYKNPENKIYKKIVVSKDVIVGAIWMGTRQGVQDINRLITSKTNIGKIKKDILNSQFDLGKI